MIPYAEGRVSIYTKVYVIKLALEQRPKGIPHVFWTRLEAKSSNGIWEACEYVALWL